MAGPFYVDRSIGSDSFPGTEASPWRTIQKAFSTVNPGETAFVKNGTYTETLDVSRSGSAGNPITVKNFAGHTPICSYSLGSVSRLYFHAGGATPVSYVTVEGITIDGAYDGIKMDGADHIVLRRMVVKNSQNQGILGYGWTNTVDRCIFSHNGWTGTALPDTQKHGFYITGQNWVITNCLVWDSRGYNLQLDGRAFNAATDPTANYSGFGNALIANNVIAYSSLESGIVFWGGGGATGVGTGNVVENNIFYQNVQAGGSGPGAIHFLNPAPGVTIVRKNVNFATAPRLTGFIDGISGTNYDASGGNITLTDPHFVNAPATVIGAPDFHLTSLSVAPIDYGINLFSAGVTTDFDGVARPSSANFDAGAYEFGGVPPDTVPPAIPTGLVVT